MKINRRILFIVFVFVGAISLPYVYAWWADADGYQFGGFLINFYDGNSYLGKILQGRAGAWLFTLDYTPESSQGALINLPYMLIGHWVRWFGGTPLFWFHSIRIIAALFLSWCLYDFVSYFFSENRWPRTLAFVWLLFGSGIGVFGLVFGLTTMDFWVAEAYPFLASFTNLHFPIGLGLMLLLVKPLDGEIDLVKAFKLIGLSVLLGLVSAFSVPVVLLVLGGVFLIRLLHKQDAKSVFWQGVWVGAGSLPVIAYDYWSILSDPVLSQWNAQNITTSPEFIDFFLSFSPALLFAIPAFIWIKDSKRQKDHVLISWVILCFALAYSPFPLQRRFFVGYSIPVVLLGVRWLATLKNEKRAHYLGIAALVFAMLTNQILIKGAIGAVNQINTKIFLYDDELAGFEWLNQHSYQGAVVLAGPDTGNYLPAYTDQKVIFGHPFESLDAEMTEQLVRDMFSGNIDFEEAQRIFEKYQVDYVFVGPREREMGDVLWVDQLSLAYAQGEVEIYAINP